MNQPTSTREGLAPLALHVRRLRLAYGNEGLTQPELGALAVVNERTVREYETLTALPSFFEPLVRVALALQVPVERLIAPREFERLRQDIEGRRRTLELAPDFSDAFERERS